MDFISDPAITMSTLKSTEEIIFNNISKHLVWIFILSYRPLIMFI